MDAIGRQIRVKMTFGLLGWEKQGFFRIPGSGYYLLILWWEMRSGGFPDYEGSTFIGIVAIVLI